MLGAGARNHRVQLSSTAGDVLPTQWAIDTVKRLAAVHCCSAAADVAWPTLEVAQACLADIPFVALSALVAACPEVRPERLARCLGLDPLDGVDALAARKAADPNWFAEMDRGLLATLAGGAP